MPKAMGRDSNPGTALGRTPLTLCVRVPLWGVSQGGHKRAAPSDRSAHPRDGQMAGFHRLERSGGRAG